MTYIAIFIDVVAWIWIFSVLFITVMAIYGAHKRNRLRWYHYVWLFPVVLAGYVFDVVSQYSLAVLVFADLPRTREHLVTDRLHRYINGDFGYRTKLANLICDGYLDIFDPSGDHCGRQL